MLLPLIILGSVGIGIYSGAFSSLFGTNTPTAATTATPVKTETVTDTPKTPDLLEKKVGKILGTEKEYDYYPQLGLTTSHTGVEVKIAPSKNPIINIKGHGKVSFDKELTALITAYDTAGKDFTPGAKEYKYAAGSSYEFDANWAGDHVLKMQGVNKPIFGNDFSS